MKRIATLIITLFAICCTMMAQSQVTTGAFSFTYDTKIWEPLPIEVNRPEEFYYEAIQRKDGTGAVFVMSSVEERTLDDYATTALRTNSLFAQGHSELEKRTVGDRTTLSADFVLGDNKCRVWFFEENGRLFNFSVMDQNTTDTGLAILKRMETFPAPSLNVLTEAELIGFFRASSENLKKAPKGPAQADIQVTAIDIDPSRKTVVCTFTTKLVDDVREAIKYREALFDPSRYERRALELGYTLVWLYRDVAGKEIGRVSYTKKDLSLLD